MRKVIGFAVFFTAMGMVVALLLPNTLTEIIIILICLLLGYNLFCC